MLTVQLFVTYAVDVLPQLSVATMVMTCVTTQQLVVITLLWLIDAVPQGLLAPTPGMFVETQETQGYGTTSMVNCTGLLVSPVTSATTTPMTSPHCSWNDAALLLAAVSNAFTALALYGGYGGRSADLDTGPPIRFQIAT